MNVACEEGWFYLSVKESVYERKSDNDKEQRSDWLSIIFVWQNYISIFKVFYIVFEIYQPSGNVIGTALTTARGCCL